MYSKIDPASVRTRTYIAICGNASINTNGHGTITSPYTVIHRVCGEEGKTIDNIDWQIGVRLVLYTVWESPVHELKRSAHLRIRTKVLIRKHTDPARAGHSSLANYVKTKVVFSKIYTFKRKEIGDRGQGILGISH